MFYLLTIKTRYPEDYESSTEIVDGFTSLYAAKQAAQKSVYAEHENLKWVDYPPSRFDWPYEASCANTRWHEFIIHVIQPKS